MELSFCDLRAKEVINISDGCRLGNIVDLVFDCFCAQITGIVVPHSRKFFTLFKSNQDIFIPWSRVCKIGKDVILVQLTPTMSPIHNSPHNTLMPPLSPYSSCSVQDYSKNKTAKQDININLNNFKDNFDSQQPNNQNFQQNNTNFQNQNFQNMNMQNNPNQNKSTNTSQSTNNFNNQPQNMQY